MPVTGHLVSSSVFVDDQLYTHPHRAMAFRLLSQAKASILAMSMRRVVGLRSRNAQRPPGIGSQDILNPLNGSPEEFRSSNFGFLALPFDVLLEIFSYLEPVDLLHLSSASRYLFRLLRSDETLYIWTSVCCFFMFVTQSQFSFSSGRLTQIYPSLSYHQNARMMWISFIIPIFSMVYIVKYVPIDVIRFEDVIIIPTLQSCASSRDLDCHMSGLVRFCSRCMDLR